MAEPLFHIVLVHPEIPQNTGGIGRLCVSTDTRLHLIEPLGFSLEDKFVRRAGLDYWPHLDLRRYADWETFLEQNPGAPLLFFSTRGRRAYWDCDYRPGTFLVFGSESSGLPPEFYERYRGELCTIPMSGTFHRSLYLANSAAIALYEALRVNRKLWECAP